MRSPSSSDRCSNAKQHQDKQEERIRDIQRIKDLSLRRKKVEDHKQEKMQQKKEAILAKREWNQKEKERIAREEEEHGKLENNEHLKKVVRPLRHAFEILDLNKDDHVSAEELGIVLTRLGMKLTKQQVSEMLWESNSDVRMAMSWKAFQEMYIRCIDDKTGLEPKNLFHVVEFLMHDAGDKGVVTMDDCMKVLLRRYGKVEDQNLNLLFGGKGPVDMLSSLTLEAFLVNIQKLALHPPKSKEISYPSPKRTPRRG